MCSSYVALWFGLIVVLNAQIHVGPGQQYADIAAAASAATPGDTIFIHASEYRGYSYYRGLRGRADAWITIKPFANDRPIVRGNWQFSSIEYVRFEKLIFQGDGRDTSGPFLNIDNGGSCATQSHHIVITQCYFGDNRTGNTLKFGGVDDFEISACTFKNQGNGSDGNAGLALNVCHNGWVHDNHFENIEGRAIQTKLGTRNVIIERNLIINCGVIDAALRIGEAGGVNFHCPDDNWTAREIFVYSNIIVGGRAAFAIGQAQNCEIIHNTIVNPTRFVFRVLAEQPIFRCDSNRIQNNIFYLTDTRYFNGTANPRANNVVYSTFVVDHNLFFYGSDPLWLPDPNGGPYDMEELSGIVVTHSIRGDPLFHDRTGSNFRLRESSPARGAGAIVRRPTHDYYGNAFKTPPSIGAIEDTTISSAEDNRQRYKVIYPNPARDVAVLVGIHLERARLYSIAGTVYYPSIEYTDDNVSLILLENVPPGAYVLYDQDGTVEWIEKLLIIR